MNDKFFTKQNCDRCGGSLEKGRMMSMFNQNCLCMGCIAKERKHADYTQALEADTDQIRKGNFNFEGIGFPAVGNSEKVE